MIDRIEDVSFWDSLTINIKFIFVNCINIVCINSFNIFSLSTRIKPNKNNNFSLKKHSSVSLEWKILGTLFGISVD